jgi:predicted nucleic acid-binding protein
MTPIVIDTSVIVSWFLPGEEGGEHSKVVDHLGKINIHVPPIFQYEFMNILLMAEKRKRIDRVTVENIMDVVSHYPIFVEQPRSVCREDAKLVDLAHSNHLTIYDAAYLELSLKLGSIPLLTYDKVLLLAAKKSGVRTKL